MEVGDIGVSNSGQEFTVLNKGYERICKKRWVMLTIKFSDTGTVMKCYQENAIAGKVRDRYAKTCYGVGWAGDFDKSIPYWKQANQLWRNILKRCYSTVDPKGYNGWVLVDPRWLCFANFLEDLPKLKNFEQWLNVGTCSHTRYQMDKDVLGDGTVYSPHTCMFLTEHENKSLGSKNKGAKAPRLRANKPK